MSTNAVSSKETYSNGKFVAGLFKFLKYAVLVFACLIVFIPLIVVFLGSLKSNTEFLSSNVFALPTKVEWNNYKTAFIDGKVLLGLKNTAIIIMISCTGTIITGTMTAYVLQRFHTLFGKVLKTAFLLATLFPAISMQVTVYRIMNSFHLVGTMAAPIILTLVQTSSQYTFSFSSLTTSPIRWTKVLSLTAPTTSQFSSK